jgi:hypothetical protein
MKTLIERKQEWWDWHKANPDVWRLFERFSLEAINMGHKRLSAWLIVNRIRWESMVVTTGNDYKITNDYIAFYARLFINKYPQYSGFFVTKKMKGEA